jgi:hypothetical protein
MDGADRARTRRPSGGVASRSLRDTPQDALNILKAAPNDDERPRFRRAAERKRGSMSNSFTSSRDNVIDNRNGGVDLAAAGAGRGAKKGGLFQFRRRTMHVSSHTFLQSVYLESWSSYFLRNVHLVHVKFK